MLVIIYLHTYTMRMPQMALPHLLHYYHKPPLNHSLSLSPNQRRKQTDLQRVWASQVGALEQRHVDDTLAWLTIKERNAFHCLRAQDCFIVACFIG